jgi:hypothetical protein
MKPPIKLLQERDFGQKINTTFEFIGQNFKPLLTAMLYIAGPAAIIAGFFNGLYQSNVLNTAANATSVDASPLGSAFANVLTPMYFLTIIFIGIATVFASQTVYAYVLKYEEQDGATPAITPSVVWDIVKVNIIAYIGYTILLTLILIAAFVFLVIPAIYIGVVFSIIYMVMLRENLGLSQAMSRCFYLIRDKWWSTFGLVIIMAFIQGIINMVFQAPVLIVTILKALKIYEGDSDILMTISGIIGTLGSVLTSCIINLAIVFQYYNLVEKKDGTGILAAIDNIGKNDEVRGEE